MRSEINWLMGKFLGVETHTKRAVVIFTITMYVVWFPVNIVMGAITFNDCSIQPKPLKIMISIEKYHMLVFRLSVWWCLLFYLYIYIPRKEFKSGLTMLSNTCYWGVTFIAATLTLGVGVLTILQSVYIASLTKQDIDRECEESQPDCKNCSSLVWVGGWIGLAFKYLNIVKLFLCCLCYFNPKCRRRNQ